MDKTCENITSSVAYEILSYLVQNPDAQDTVEGITEWWLLQQRIVQREILIREAVTQLVHHKFLVERKSKYFRTQYRVNRAKIDEIQILLKERGIIS